jgi:hypothetical protein
MRALFLSLTLIAGSLTGAQQSQDAGVYRAVLEHTVGPQAKKYAAYWKVDPSGPLLIAAQTDSMCAKGPPAGMGCVNGESFQVFEGTHPRANTVAFAGLIDDGTRRKLADAFRTRNAASARLDAEAVPEVKLVPPADLRGFDTRKWSAPGYSRLSLPAYAGRHALVYASFTCGGLCGYGWLVLLEQHEGRWRVVGRHDMWIS